MVTVQQATEIVLANQTELLIEKIPLEKAVGRVLRETIVADRDFPPFHRSERDGIAIAYAAFAQGQRTFPIEGVQAAGMPQKKLENPLSGLEIMTGAPLPDGTDTVIMYEDIQMKDSEAIVQLESIQPQQYVHQQGVDRKKGEVILPANTLLSAVEIGVLASVGKSFIEVSRPPKVVIISTGDELVPISQQPLPHQIRRSNAYMLQAALFGWKIISELKHLLDEEKEVENELRRCLADYDVLLISGGVSKGKFDYVPAALEKLGVEKLFHGVQQQPGKPFWFGRATTGARIFALPGNPVSSFLCLHRYFQPWLWASLGLPTPSPLFAQLTEDVTYRKDLTYFLQVKLSSGEDGSLYAQPMEGHGSGDFANMTEADGFLELPAEKSFFRKGEVYRVYWYRPTVLTSTRSDALLD